MSDRETCLVMADVLIHTNKYEEMVSYMKKIVDANPQLSAKERTYLVFAYKNIITPRRQGIRYLITSIEDGSDEHVINEFRKQKIHETKEIMAKELNQYSTELIELIDHKILPVTTEPESIVFYGKLKGDYYRYLCEAAEDQERDSYQKLATESYEKAFELCQKDLKPFEPTSLGLVLNYSVFLFEIIQDKQKAIDLAKKALEESTPLIDQNSENSLHEVKEIMSRLGDNINLWQSSIQEE